MGRLESLTSLALGRGPYEAEVVERDEDRMREIRQQYSSNGRPRNPETKRREREHVRAANEVMQVTGIVEDSIAAKVKVTQALMKKNQETLTGLRLMEGGRIALVAGVWGALGLRRRILLYQPYSHIGFLEIIRRERAASSITHMLFSGIPTVVAYHLSDWVAFFLETVLEAVMDTDEAAASKVQTEIRSALQIAIEAGCCYVTLHFRLFATLQQLNLVPSSKLLPSLGSFIPFSPTSPLIRPPPLVWSMSSLLGFGTALLKTAAPLLIILAHGRIKYFVSRLVYRPIYKSLPRPTGDSMFSGLAIAPPALEYDAPDQDRPEGPEGSDLYRGEDESTLRALEGLPALERAETRNRSNEGGPRDSDDEDAEIAQAAIISFDVEASENAEPTLGSWSAELRSANEPKPSEGVTYKVTGLTMLPTIMATEGLREAVAGLLVLPLEAIMVRLIGRAFRQSAGRGVDDMWGILPSISSLSFGNILPAIGIQVIFTGIVWGGFTIVTYVWKTSVPTILEDQAPLIDAASQST